MANFEGFAIICGSCLTKSFKDSRILSSPTTNSKYWESECDMQASNIAGYSLYATTYFHLLSLLFIFGYG